MATGQSVWITLVTVTAALVLVVVRGQGSSTSSQTPSTTVPQPATENYTLENTTHEYSETQGTGFSSIIFSSDAFTFTPTVILLVGVGGFAVLVALPLLIIMILIVALGCVCKKYKRLKKRFTLLPPPPQIIASTTQSREPPTSSEKENSVILKNIEMLNVSENGTEYIVVESQAVAKEDDSSTVQQTQQTSDEKGSETKNDGLTVDAPMVDDIDTGDNVAYGRLSLLSESHDVARDEASNLEDREEEVDRDTDETGSYVINDLLYSSISF